MLIERTYIYTIFKLIVLLHYISNGLNTIEYLSPKATSAILAAYDSKTAKHRRNRMMLILLYDSRARVQELSVLNISSLHTDAPSPYITLVGKERKSRNVLLMGKMVKHLEVNFREFHPLGDEITLFYSLMDAPHKLSLDSISLVLKKLAAYS